VATEEDVSLAARLFTARLPARCLGAALLVAVIAPAVLNTKGGAGFAVWLSLVGVGFAWWAAPPVTDRSEQPRARLHQQLARHRNTVLAVVAVLISAFIAPVPWLAAASTALLLTYLLHVDTFSDVYRSPGRAAITVAYLASGVVLLAALVPTGHSTVARLLACVGVAAAAGAVGLTLYERRAEPE
jgi:hypothetical protein